MTKQSSIVDFWRAVELFEPQSIKKENSKNNSGELFEIISDDDLLWNKNHRQNKNFRYNAEFQYVYTIYCGVIKTSKIIEVFEDLFGKDDVENLGRTNNEITAVFTFKVNNFGQPIPDSFILSSWAWLLGKTLSNGFQDVDWLNGFDDASAEFRDYFSQKFSLLDFEKVDTEKSSFTKYSESDADSEPKSISYTELMDVVRLICEKLYLMDMIGTPKIGLTVYEYEKKPSENKSKPSNNDADFLNSFYQKDLGLISKEVNSGNFGEGLKSYLTSDQDLNIDSRIDLQNSVNVLFDRLSPELFSSGRWADKGMHPLAFSQQFAVNSILEKLEGKNSGLFSVNGAPGTGKTTMLKDVIAAIVVKRAKLLAKFSDPTKAFGNNRIELKSETFPHKVAPVDNSLKKSGIVIASTNNAAVENITKEFPVKSNFNKEWQKECEYFPEIASHLLEEPAWGLIAAALGKKENRYKFCQSMWFDKETNFKDLLDYLTPPTNEQSEEIWRSAVVEFNDALAKEENIKRNKTQLFRQIIEREFLSNKLKQFGDDTVQSENKIDEIQNQIKTQESYKEELASKRGSLIEQKTRHDEERPSIFSIIASWGKNLKEWKIVDKKNQSDLAENGKKIVGADQEKRANTDKLKESKKTIDRLKRETLETSQKLDQITKVLNEEYSKDERHSIPNIENWSDINKEKEREISAPWFDEEWNSARVNVFAKAMQLQKAFILANAKSIKANLSAVIDILSGKIQGAHNLKGASDAWATLFLIVPVVSTTFASFDRLFKTLGREEIGWLLIDEAGQVVPQAAVGAIWRSQRTVVVGDPLQLEPVSTIPEKMQLTLAKLFEVSDTWLPGNTSVQELADRVNNFGTYIGNDDEKIWVGSPLRVHRRCQNPMFDISNKIAYGEMMIYGTADETKYSKLPASHWIDIKSNDSNGHWIPAEGIAAEKLIDDLIRQGCEKKHIFLISPFSKVAANLTKIKDRKNISESGTIHTTQGKENFVVILVLGGNPDKPGAKSWASEKPNLLNVAVSRAKERVYVIGNREKWSKYQYFETLNALIK